MFLRYALPAILAILLPALPLAGQDRDVRVLENALAGAVQLYQDGEFDKAAAMCRAIIDKDSSFDAAHYYLGLCSAGLGDMEEAELHLMRASQLDSANYWYRQRLAVFYQASQRSHEAIEEYESISRDFPRKTEVYGSLAELYAQDGRLDESLSMLDKIDTLMGLGDGSAMMRFQIYCQTGRTQQAYDFLESVDAELGSPQVKCILGDYNLSMYRDSAAFALYDEALAIAPDYAPALLGKAEAYRTSRRDEEYFNILDAFVQNPEFGADVKCDYLRQVYQHSDRRFMAACAERLAACVDAVSQTHPDSSDAGLLALSVRLSNDDFEAALPLAQELAVRFPDNDVFLELASYAAYHLNRYDVVLDIERGALERALKAGDSKKAASSYGNIGDMYYNLGDPKKAYKSYKAALALDAECVPVLNNYAYYLSLTGKQLSKAAKMSRKTIEKEPDNATYLDTYGWIFHLQGKDTEALAVFKRAMIYGGKDSATMLRHYADVLEACGKTDLAQMYRRQAESKAE